MDVRVDTLAADSGVWLSLPRKSDLKRVQTLRKERLPRPEGQAVPVYELECA
jgi:hypothetical protein